MLLNSSSQDGFQQEGSIDVRPFIDPEDGGSLNETPSSSIPMYLTLMVSIIALSLILPKVLGIISVLKKARDYQDSELVFISDLATQYSLEQDEVLNNLEQLEIEMQYEEESGKPCISGDSSERFKDYLAQKHSEKDCSEGVEESSQPKIKTIKWLKVCYECCVDFIRSIFSK
ncbi:hypothetical protein [Roseofilum capinflatum]|uniref:Uncharacterized protein n=1 Tax=Roseofilum capinflatum BLCC-M114 TaxID=3022440 RepID=A0ABT7B948_9CYAN|nr:hypothetical protein [Roseofilum capinflatum]MDJ1175707.1 hypothetical protein [Roseofilum capinflatum BLCC-M114]